MSELGDKLARESLKYINSPYRYAGTTPSGFDCSGFVAFIVHAVTGRMITGDSHVQMYLGSPVPKDSLERGDILGFDTMSGGEIRADNAVSHVGIYIGDGRMMNCVNETVGCKVSDIQAPYWNGNGASFVEARRLSNGQQQQQQQPDERETEHHDRSRRIPRPRRHKAKRLQT